MGTHRAKAIIAVFGSDESASIPLAKDLGIAICERDHILLTGGTGSANLSPEERETVKERAILGAESVRATGRPAPWIGISRNPDARAASVQRADTAFSLETDLDHRRNCLEACLCDAALALEGGDGTVSEALFSLSLGKPVAFVGDTWRAYGLGVSEAGASWDAMARAAFRRVGVVRHRDAPLDELFDQEQVLLRITRAATYRFFPTPTRAAVLKMSIASLTWLEDSIGCTFKGYFPAIARYASQASAYDAWLSRIGL